MDPQVEAGFVTGAFGLVALVPSLVFRRKSKSSQTIRRSLNRQEALENYAFVLRRQLSGANIKPRPWPRELVYLNKDDHDESIDEEES